MISYFHTHTTRGLRGERGYVLLLAGIIATIVTTLGVLVASFVKNDLALAGSAQDSDLAFYAARSVAECGQYYEFSSTKNNSFAVPRTGNLALTCMGVTSTFGSVASGEAQIFTFDWTTSSGQAICSRLFVIKTSSGGVVTSRMLARGYNVPCASITTGANVAERVIQYTY